MKHKLLFLLLAMVSPLAAFATVGDEFTVTFDKITISFAVISEEAGNKTCKVHKDQGVGEIYSAQVYTIDEGWNGELTIPDVVDRSESDTGYKVVEISNGAFLGCTSLKSLTIGSNVERIGIHTFSGCENLESVTIGNKVKTIDDSAFRSTSLTSIRIPLSVESVGEYAFCNCCNLSSIYIENGNAEWGLFVFNDCDALSSIKIEYHSPTCKAIICLNSLKELIKEIVIGDEVTTIDREAFYRFGITEVNIPNSVTTIGELAFSECNNLKSVTIPSSVTSVGYCAFSECSSLTSVTVNCKNVGDWFGASNNHKNNIEELVLGEGVETIEENAFRNNEKLTTIVLPSTLTVVGDEAFSGCSSLTNATINCKEIGNWLAGLTALKTVVVGDKTETILQAAFADCPVLESVTLGKSVTTIGQSAFSGCEELVSINIPQGLIEIGDWAFHGSKIKSFVVPASIETIGDDAFGKCDALTSVEFHCAEIGEWFSVHKNLSEIIMGDEVTSIGDYAFPSCSSIEELIIGKNVTKIGDGAFYKCSKLKSLVIPENVITIGDDAFYNCSSLQEVKVLNETPITDISENAFHGSNYETQCILRVPKGSISKYTEAAVWKDFKYILEEGDNPGELEVIIDGALYILSQDGVVTFGGIDKSEAVGSYVIPNTITYSGILATVTVISPNAFKNCTELVSLTIPEKIRVIGAEAFKGCSGLKEIICLYSEPIDLSPLGENISQFNGIDFETCVLYVPAGSKEKYEQADGWKDFKNIVEMGETIPITIGKSGKASYCGNKSLDFSFSEEIKAYIATGFDKDEEIIWLTRVKDVPAGTPVLIKGEAEKTYDVPVTDSENSYYTNMFKGNISGETVQVNETDGDKVNYYLSGDGTFKSVKGYANIGNNKSYLQLPGTFAPAEAGATQTVKVGSAGKASYAAPVDLDFTNVDGLKAFSATGYDKSSKTIWLTRVMKVQKGEGVLLKGDAKDYEIPSTVVQSSYMNMFVGNTSAASVQVQATSADGSKTNFYLKGDGTFVSVNGYVNIGNNKCYLELPTEMVAGAASTRGAEANYILEEPEVIKLPITFRSIDNDSNGTTGVKEVKSKGVKSEEWFTLQGQRVVNPGKGIYIRNGKKVVIK